MKPIPDHIRTFKADVTKIQKEEFLKSQAIKSKLTNQNTYYTKHQVGTPIKEDPLTKAKKLLDDANSVLQIYLSVGNEEDEIVVTMKNSIKTLAGNYFNELTKLNFKSTASTSSIPLTQSSISDSNPELAFDMSSFI
jgi:hypothetical protein